MVRPKLRRSIYIGLGGTGCDAIMIVKKYFTSTTGRVPSMIRFLAVDTNQPELERKGFDPMEQLAFVMNHPQSIYRNSPEKFAWLPPQNVENIQGIGNTGAGQIRSNGAFVLAVKEMTHDNESFSSRLSTIKDNLVRINVEDADYDLLATGKIDVHLCFSLCGGTGSGMFLEIAKLIKEVIPNSNLIGYALSHSFYENVGVHKNVKSNAYASLLELDYCMHAHKNEYQQSTYEPIAFKPFDAFMYIDNRTYTRNETEQEYSYEREEVLANIGYAMVLSAGSLGDDANSIIDNLNGAIIGGLYDIECKTGKKSAWVSSLGVSEIFCKKNGTLDLFAHNLAIKELSALRDGSPVNAVETAKAWINDLQINEGGPGDAGDKDELIDKMINPTLYKALSPSSIKVDDVGNVDESIFRSNAPIRMEDLDSVQHVVSESLINKLQSKVYTLLFPSQGASTCGLTHLENVLSTFNETISKYSEQLSKEIQERNIKIAEKQETEKETIKEIKRESNKRWDFQKDQQKISSCKNSIRLGRVAIFQLELAIKRRQMAIQVYSELMRKISTEYLQEIARLRNVLTTTISELTNEVIAFELPEKLEKRSTSIDVSSEIGNLQESKVDNQQINDWRDFYTQTQKSSFKELADKKDWKEFVLSYIKKVYPIQTTQPIIKILQSINEKGTLRELLVDVVNRARPLMDISTYGKTEELKPEEFTIVSLPGADANETKFIREILENEFHDKNLQFVSIIDANRIIVYRQLGVIPPYYLKGVSSGKNGEYNRFSCEEDYKTLKSSRFNYSPFTKNTYEKAIEKGGHTLDSFLGAISDSDNIEMWVSGFILGMFSRKSDGEYRFVSSAGEIDMSDPNLKTYINLGKTRAEAFSRFEGLDDSVKREFSNAQTEILKDSTIRIEYDKFFDGTTTAFPKYRNTLSLLSNNEYEAERATLSNELNYMLHKNRIN